MITKTRVLSIQFANEIKSQEIPLFRGAVIGALDSSNILFHNHKEDGFRYSYPLIQYKRKDGKAMIICIGEGTEAIGCFFQNANLEVSIGTRMIKLEISDLKAYQFITQIWNDLFTYRINRWMPLNKENYEIFRSNDSIADRYAMLENILTGNILSFAKGIGVFFDKEVICKITDINEPHLVQYKDTKMMIFNATFKSNVSLPDYIGLGKGVSIGYGEIRKQNNYNTNNYGN